MRTLRNAAMCLLLLPAVALSYTYPQLKSYRSATAWTNEVINRINLTRVIVSMSGTPTNTTGIYIVNGVSTSLLVQTAASAFTTAVWPVGTNQPDKYLYTGDKIVAINTSTNSAALYIYGTEAVTGMVGGAGSGFPMTNNGDAATYSITNAGTLQAKQIVANTATVGRITSGISSLGAAGASSLQLLDGTVDEFADITTSYLTAGNAGTDPGGQRARFTLSKSGTSIQLSGWIKNATNDALGNIYPIDPGSTGAVESLFLKSGTNGTGRLYYSGQSAPNNYTYFDLPLTATGLLMWVGGTGFQFGSQTNAIGTATNTILFGDRDTNYWRNFASQTNAVVFDDGVAVIVSGASGIPLLGWDAGTNVSVSIITQAVAGVTGRVARLNVGGSATTNALLLSVNSWEESNSFTKAVTLPRLMMAGRGNSMTGAEAQVIGGSTNTASGVASTAGGVGNIASGKGSLAIGWYNTALSESSVSMGSYNLADTYAAALGYDNQALGVGSVAAGRGNRSSGNYSMALGQENVVAGDYSGAFGAYISITNDNAWAIGRGQAVTNKLSPAFANTFILMNMANTNEFRVGVGTAAPTSTLDVAGSINALRFSGDGSGLTGLVSSVTAAVAKVVSGGVTSAPSLLRFSVGSGGSVTQASSGAETTVYVPSGGGSSTNVTAENLEANSPGHFSTGTPVYVESDPVWTGASNLYYQRSQADVLFSTGTPVYAESDPLSVTGAYVVGSIGTGNVTRVGKQLAITYPDGTAAITGLVLVVSGSGNVVTGVLASGSTVTEQRGTISGGSPSYSRIYWGNRWEGSINGGWAQSFAAGVDDISTDATTNVDQYAAFVYTASAAAITNVLYGEFAAPVTNVSYALRVRANQPGGTVIFTATDGTTATSSTQAIAAASTTYATNVVLPGTSVTNVKLTIIYSTTNAANLYRMGIGR